MAIFAKADGLPGQPGNDNGNTTCSGAALALVRITL
jgi:hypothetical protein